VIAVQAPTLSLRCLCAPSQNGEFAVALQVQRATFLFSVIVKASGSMPLPECEPSQYGWVKERPQAHQW
jgi:hypothetical protein